MEISVEEKMVRFPGIPEQLAPLKLAFARHHATWIPLSKRLRHEAGQTMSLGPWSVLDKKHTPPSGDKHDYLSHAAYWWPNPDTPDGLPYVSRDGEVNPEIEEYDGTRFRQLLKVVPLLAQAAFLLDKPEYGERARLLLKRWFLNPATAMNPHLRYAAYTRGVWEGSGWGIIDAHGLVEVVHGLELLRSCGCWDWNDHQAFTAWIAQFLLWLQTSEEGRFESNRMNNHATAFDHLCCTLALYLRRTDLAKKILEEVPDRRIGTQLEHNGRQPWENARTESWGYSTLNLGLLMDLADMGRQLDVPLWEFATGDGRSIRKTFNYMLPFALGQAEWPWETISGWRGAGERWIGILRQASAGWSDPTWEGMIPKLDQMSGEEITTSLMHLRHPASQLASFTPAP